MQFYQNSPPQIQSRRRFAKNGIGTETQLSQLNYVAETLIQCLNVYQDLRTISSTNYEFTEGDSWEDSLKEQLLKRGITPLEINIILPRILSVIGQFLETRGRLIAIPTQDAGVVDAEVGTKLLEWQNEQNKLATDATRDQELIWALCDAMISELGGWLEVYQDNSRDPLGIQVVQRVSPFMVFPDPAVDLRQCATKGRFMIKTPWWPVEKIIHTWPDKRAEIERVTGQYNRTNWWQSLTNLWPRITGSAEEMRAEFVKQRENMFRIVEFQERRYEKVTRLFNPFDGRIDGPMSKQEAQAIIAQAPEYQAIEEDSEVLWTTVTLGDWMILDEYPNTVQNGMFSLIPLPGYSFSGKNFSPILSQLKGIQNEKNQARTSFLTILRSNAFGGWIYERGALSEDMEEKLEEYGASAGFNMVHEPGRTPPQRIQYQAISAGDIQRDEMSMRDAENVTALSSGTLGIPEYSGESGILHRQRVVQAVKAQRLLFQMAENTEANVARYLFDLMNIHLQPGRVIEVVGQEAHADRLVYNGDFRLDLWKVKIIEGDQSETQRMRKLLEMREYTNMLAAMQLPPQYYQTLAPVLLKLMTKSLNWAQSEDLLQALEEMQSGQIPIQVQAQLLQALNGIESGQVGGQLPAGNESQFAESQELVPV